MTTTADVVVAGAGHNSLITAAYLAAAGLRGARARRARDPGRRRGDARSCCGPGYRIDSCSTGAHADPDQPAAARRRARAARPTTASSTSSPTRSRTSRSRTARHLTMWLDVERTCEEIARFSQADAAAYRPHARRVRRGQGHLRRGDVHAARASARRSSSAWPSTRAAGLAAAAGDERAGTSSATSSRIRARPRVHALAGVPDARAGRPPGSGQLAYVDRLRPPAALVDAAARRLGRADRRARALHRGPRRGGPVPAAGRPARPGRRPLRRRRDRDRRALPRPARRSSRPSTSSTCSTWRPADVWAEEFRYGVETFDVGLSGVRRPPRRRPCRRCSRPRTARAARCRPGSPGSAAGRSSTTSRALRDDRYADDVAWLLVATPTLADPVARARGPAHGEVPQRPAVARRARGLDGRAQGATGRAPARARPRRARRG